MTNYYAQITTLYVLKLKYSDPIDKQKMNRMENLDKMHKITQK